MDASVPAGRCLDYDREELLGKALAEVLDEGARGAIGCLLAGPARRVDLAATLRGRNNLRVPCELTASAASIDGRALLVVIARDIKGGAGDGRSDEAYRAVFQSSDDGIIVMDPETGRAVDANEAACRMFGCSSREAAGLDFLGTLEGGERMLKGEVLQKLKASGREGPVLLEARVRGPAGAMPWVEISMKRSRVRGDDRVVAVVRDITKRKAYEDRIMASLQEKEVMLKEIHHRVKNNLQVISSLLSIQSKFLSDPRDAERFMESQDRIKTMALVHEKLYQSSDLATIDFSPYIERLATNLFRSYSGRGGSVNLRIDVKDVFLNIDTAIPCGLIVNELVTNALKYAFPGDRDGVVTIAMRQEGDDYLLVVGDDGVGLPPGLDLEQTGSLGLQLVSVLVKQIEGTIQIDGSQGTRYNIRFRK